MQAASMSAPSAEAWSLRRCPSCRAVTTRSPERISSLALSHALPAISMSRLLSWVSQVKPSPMV